MMERLFMNPSLIDLSLHEVIFFYKDVFGIK